MSLPEDLAPLLWSYDLASLDEEGDRDLIIRAVLARGTWSQIGWLFRTYDKNAIRHVVEEDLEGLRTLPLPTLNLWSLYFWSKPVPPPASTVDRWRGRRIPPSFPSSGRADT